MKRRDLLKASVLAGTLALIPKAGAQGAPQNTPSLGRRYRNLIVFVYDGFSWEDYAIAQAYARRRQGRLLTLERLLARYPNGSSTPIASPATSPNPARPATPFPAG